MELPHIGLSCTDPDCNQLDFLPIKCDACKNIFCAEHYKYIDHHCVEGQKRNNVVPTCERCHSLEFHLNNHCLPYKKTKIYNNRCNQKECKRKELIQIRCDECELVFCIKHRHSEDHDCRGKTSKSELCAKAAERRLRDLTLTSDPKVQRDAPRVEDVPPESCAAEQRATNAGNFANRVTGESVKASNANLSEEEALALAIAESKAEAKKREDETRKRLVDAAASRESFLEETASYRYFR